MYHERAISSNVDETSKRIVIETMTKNNITKALAKSHSGRAPLIMSLSVSFTLIAYIDIQIRRRIRDIRPVFAHTATFGCKYIKYIQRYCSFGEIDQSYAFES